MSTKTTFKRIALVAVAALGLSLVAVAPSNAAPVAVNLYHTVYSANGNCNAAGSYACSPVTSDTSWVLINETATYGFQTTFLAGAASDAVTHSWTPAGTGSLWQYPLITITNWKAADQYGPAGGAAGGFYGGFDDNSGWGFAGTSAAAPTGAAVTNGTGTVSGLSAITTATAAGGTIGNFKNQFIPTVAGTYVWELKSAQGGPTYTWTINAYSTQAAKDAGVPIRIGVNAGSLEKDILEKFKEPCPEALVESAERNIKILEDLDFLNFKISVKASDIFLAVNAYRQLSKKCDYPLHLGITEAGSYYAGTIKSSIGIGMLLSEGIGDTIRISLSSDPVNEVKAGLEILKSLNLKNRGVKIISCPSCARQAFEVIKTVEILEQRLSHIKEPLTLSIIGCVVNGPGEASQTDIGLTGGGKGSNMIYLSGLADHKVPSENIIDHIVGLVEKKAEQIRNQAL